MAALVWTGSGTWDNSSTANWIPPQVPVAGDTITLAATSAGTMTIGTSAIGGTLDLTNAAAGFTLAFGSNVISLSGSGNVTIFTGSTNVTVTATSNPLIEVSWSSGTATITAGAVTENNSISFTFLTGFNSNVITGAIRDYTVTSGSTRTMASATTTFYGSINIASTSGWASSTLVRTMAATGGIKTITANGLALDSPWTFDGVGGTFRLVDALSCSSRTVTLTNGTLDLNNNNLTCAIFSSSNTNVRTLTVGTGLIYVVSTGTIYTTSTSTNLTRTTTPTVISTNSSASTKTLAPGSAAPINLQVTAGSGSIILGSGGSYNNIDLTGSTSAVSLQGISVSGNITAGSATFLAGNVVLTLNGTGTQLLDFGGSSFDRNITCTGSGIYRLTNSLTITAGTGRLLTVTTGTFDSNGYAVNIPVLTSTGAGVRGVTFGSSVWIVTNATATAWNVTTPTNFTSTAGTGKISMSGATAKSFIGGGKTYPIIENSGAGALTIDGGNTFNNIAATVAAPAFIFTINTTTTFLDWTLSGTAGNLVVITTTSAGTRATMTKASGTISVDYLNIKDIAVTGSASWYAGANSTNSGNNSTAPGWIFTTPPISSGSFILFF